MSPRQYLPWDPAAYKAKQKRANLKRTEGIANGTRAPRIRTPGSHHPVKSDNLLAIDGEGVTDSNGIHRYILLAASDGSCVESSDLSTIDCFNYLLSLPSKDHLIVGFALNYDFNMMLKDVVDSPDKLTQLWTDGETMWRGYNISWIPTKKFSISYQSQSVTVWDAFGFFQCSFVNALKQWKIGTDDEIARILSMKESRGTFTEAEYAQIKAYCFDEVRLMVLMMQKLLDTCTEQGIKLGSYHGAGSIASALLSKHHIKQYLDDPPSEEIYQASLHAYFGGRFEISRIGLSPEVCYNYDIRSAYPYQITKLPCLKHGTWTWVNYDQIETISTTGMYHIYWELDWFDDIGQFTPFPRRSSTGRIGYPADGEGWYWGDELSAALEMFPNDIVVFEGYVYHQECDHVPFHWVEDLYNERNRLKEAGNFGQMILKLGMNSLYGKMAQTIGAKDRKPAYQSFIWAGIITSGTRAQILRAIRISSDSVISIATDGIISTKKLSLNISTNLGGWEESREITNLFFIQPGMYSYTVDGRSISRTRGFSPKELDFSKLREAFVAKRLIAKYTFSCTRFIGLGGSLCRNPPLVEWRQWKRIEKIVTFKSFNRLAMDDKLSYIPTINVSNLDKGHEMSYAYKPKTIWADMWKESPELVNFIERLEQPEFVE
jgi:hypothetical protein